MFKLSRQQKDHRYFCGNRYEKYSIKKLKVGAASVLIGAGFFLGYHVEADEIDAPIASVTDSGYNRTGTGNSVVADTQEFVMVTHEKPGGVVEDVAILKSKFSENLEQLKKDYPGFTATSLQSVGENKYKITYVPVTTTNQPSSTTESAANTGDTGTSNSTPATTNQTQPTTENKVSLQGHLVGNQTEYNVGEQIISTFRLDVSAPSKLEEGSYILVNLPENEPITDVQFGTALRVEKVTDTQYKIYTGEVPSGSYGNFNISYKFDKYRTGRNSQTSITSQVMDKNGNPISPEKTTKSVVANTNKSGYASIHVDSESGARDLALFNTNAPGDTIDETKNKELVLKLTTLNKEVAAVNKIQHAITLPTGAVVSETSINAGWTQEGNIARYTRTITDAKPVFDQGNNTSDDTLRINMRQAGTLEEFLKGKEFTFTDNVTYTDKSGETNTSQGTTSLVVKAVNPYKDNGDGATPNTAGAQPPLVINNYTNEQNHENRVNIAIPGINAETDDKRIIVFWRSVDTPTKVKEVELTIDSDFDQKRSIEFYGTWNKNGAYAAWYAPDNLGTSNTFEVYTVNGTTETKLGEIAFKKNGGTSIDLPEGTTRVLLKPKGEMTFTNDTLSQAGIYLHQNLKGLEKAKQMVAEGKEAKSIVTAKISTQDTDVVNTSISKTILADARTALKLTSRTRKIETVLAGNKTQSLSSGIEAYDYSPSGLGNRVYSTYTSHGATTDKKLDYLGTQNPKIIVELPDGFSYAGNSPLVTKDDNYQNTGKRVLIIDPKDSNTRENVTPDLEFNVAQWVQTGSYRLKYTLVWDENRFLHGLNPNNEFDGDKTIINTSTFTYEIPVSNTSATRLHVDVTDKNDQREGYTTSLQNLAPKADVTYRFTLSNTDNSKLSNNEVLVTLPKKDDKNIVDTSIARNSAFDVEATGEAIAPAGWTAYYLTSPISGNANEVAAATTLTADQVTDWSKVTAVKFVSNPGTTLNPGLSNEFLVPARISKDAKDKQVAYISAAAKTNAEEIYNEANVASVTIKTENIKNGAVKIAYEDMQGNTIKPTITAIEKRAYTKDYNVDTEEYRPDEFTYNEIAYRFMKVKETSAPVEGVINSEEITVTYVYDTLYENVPETKIITRTIKYVDASNETTEVSPKVVQTVTLTRTNKRNKVTNTLEEGTWTTGSWAEQASPSPANYGTPDQTSVSSVAVTPAMKDTEVVVKYPQAVDTKTVATKQTVTYEGAEDKTPAPNEQTDYTFTGKTNKVTNVTTWNEETHTYGVVTTPKVEGYYADKAQAGGQVVTPTSPEASDKVVYKPLGKVILVDEGGNEIPNTPKPTYKNNPNDPTVGGETPIPEIPDGYEIKPKQDVPGFNPEGKVVTPPRPGEDTRIVLVAKQGDITKATKQTVTYEGAEDKTPAPNEQTDYTFTGKTNKVTNVTTWNEETHTYGVVTTPKVEGYYADKAQAGGQVVTPTSPEASDKVVYKPLGKVILVDEGGNEIPNTPKPTYKNNPNDPTVGGETPIPEIPDGYEIKPKQDVPGFNPEGKVVTPPKPGEDTRIVLVAKQGDITKATKQTVTYEGAEDKTPAPNEQTDYTFTGKTNKVTNVTTWNEETHTYGVVTTPKVEGYYADKAQAGGQVVTPTSPEASDKVVYKPLGKVILVDEGGNEIPNTPKPTYKNNPNDPTVGGETPIPEIPDGYEIKPKQDVPGFNPEGKVVTPPKPGEDTRIVLVKANQKATVTYIVEGTSTVLHTDNLEGKSGEPIEYSTVAKLAELKALGYDLVTDGFTTATYKNYDNNPKVDQSFLVTVVKTVPVTPTTPQNPNEDPKNPNPGDPIDPKNPNGPKWTKEALDKLNNIKSVTRTITYVKDGTDEEVSTTEAPKVMNKVSFTRTVVVNPKDGSVVGYDTTGDGIADVAATDTTSGWKSAGTAKFAEVKSPVVKGYVVKPNQDTQGDLVEADGSKVKASTTDLTVDSPNQDLKVRYVPVGTWTPKVPEGETPINPIPYPNDPTDPGKVVDPNDPTNPNDPNKPTVPVVPHIPGTTPKDPNGNPLKPVDPKDPSKGYEVPSTPETPEQPVVPVQPEQPTTPTQPAVPTPTETSVPTDSATQPATPKYVEGQKELPNTGTKANASLLGLGILGALSGFGLLGRKKKED